MKIRAFFVFSGSNLYIFEFRRLNTKYIEFIKASHNSASPPNFNQRGNYTSGFLSTVDPDKQFDIK